MSKCSLVFFLGFFFWPPCARYKKCIQLYFEQKRCCEEGPVAPAPMPFRSVLYEIVSTYPVTFIFVNKSATARLSLHLISTSSTQLYLEHKHH